MALASRREKTPALSDATREFSAKTLQKDILLKALHHQKLTLANHHSPLEPFLSQGHLLPMKAVALYVLTPSWMTHIKQETEISHNGIWHSLNFWIALPLNEFHLKTYQTMCLQSVQSQNVHSLPTYLCWSWIRINTPGLLRKSDPTPKVYKWYLLCFLNRRMNQNSSLFCIWIWISCIFYSFQTKLMDAAVTHISNHTTLKKCPSRLSAWARGQTASPINSIPSSLDECYHCLYFSFISLYPPDWLKPIPNQIITVIHFSYGTVRMNIINYIQTASHFKNDLNTHILLFSLPLSPFLSNQYFYETWFITNRKHGIPKVAQNTQCSKSHSKYNVFLHYQACTPAAEQYEIHTRPT